MKVEVYESRPFSASILLLFFFFFSRMAVTSSNPSPFSHFSPPTPYRSSFFLRLRSIFIFVVYYFMERERRTLRSELSFKYSPGVLNSRQWNFILGQGLRQKSFRCKNYPFGTTCAKGDEILYITFFIDFTCFDYRKS